MKALTWILAITGISAVVYLIVNAPSTQYASGDPDVEGAAIKSYAWGSKQRVTGTGGSLLGKAKQGIGNITGDDQLAGEGALDETAGAVKDAAGQAAQAVGNTIHDLNR